MKVRVGKDSLIPKLYLSVSFVQFGQLQRLLAEGTEDCGQTLGIDREIGVLQQLRGDGGLVGIIVVHDVHCGSPFDFEKLCLKGGLDGLVSLSPSRRQFLAVCQVARKNFGRAEGPLYNQRTFLKNLAPFFQKTFLAPDPPSTELSESETGFVPDFSKKFRGR